MRKIQTQLHWNGANTERITGVSLTVPNHAMSIREIISRYARGLPLDQRTPIYYGDDEEFIDPRRMDLVDRQEYAEYAKQQLSEINSKLRKTNLPKEG